MRLKLLEHSIEFILFGELSKPNWELDLSVQMSRHVLSRNDAGKHGLSRKKIPRVSASNGFVHEVSITKTGVPLIGSRWDQGILTR